MGYVHDRRRAYCGEKNVTVGSTLLGPWGGGGVHGIVIAVGNKSFRMISR